MPLVPSSIVDLLQFCRERAPGWLIDAPSIGLSAAQAQAFAAAFAAGEAAYQSRKAAVQAARVATVEQSDRIRELRRSAGDTIALIRAYAQNQPDPNAIYNTANLPPPAKPSPAPPPGQPVMIRAELNNTGSLTLRWKAVNNSSNGPVVYSVARRIGAAPGPLVGVGSIGTRSFTDASIPAGSSVVTYVITPQRGQSTGTPSDEFVVRFGTVGGGGMVIASQGAEGAGGVKLAA